MATITIPSLSLPNEDSLNWGTLYNAALNEIRNTLNGTEYATPTDITTLNGLITGLDSDIDSLETRMDSAEITTESHITAIGNLVPRMEAVETLASLNSGKIDTINTTLESLLIDVGAINISISAMEERTRDIALMFGTGGYTDLFGIFEIRYSIKHTTGWGIDEEYQRFVTSSASAVNINKPAEGHEVYAAGTPGEAVLHVSVRFRGVGGSVSPWSNRNHYTFNEPAFTVENLANTIKDNSDTMEALADLLANKVVLEAFYKQQEA